MPQCDINLAWPITYSEYGFYDSEEVFLLLHGWQQRGQVVLDKLRPYCPDHVRLVAPDAPFPAPHQGPEGLRLGYGWYLFDPATQIYHVPMTIAVNMMHAFMTTVCPSARKVRVLGYSQGGYLAPFVAEALTNIVQVIGINCRFRDEVLTRPLPFRLDAVHGEKDVLVNPTRSMQSHCQILKNGNRGVFHPVADAGHGINRDIGEAVAALCRISEPTTEA